jgi:hypothetical protein
VLLAAGLWLLANGDALKNGYNGVGCFWGLTVLDGFLQARPCSSVSSVIFQQRSGPGDQSGSDSAGPAVCVVYPAKSAGQQINGSKNKGKYF